MYIHSLPIHPNSSHLFVAFNAIVRVCLKQLLPAIYRFLRIKIVTTSKLKPETSPNWKYMENVMKKYLMNFTRVCFTHENDRSSMNIFSSYR